MTAPARATAIATRPTFRDVFRLRPVGQAGPALTAVSYLVVILACLVAIGPFFYILSASVKDSRSLFHYPPDWIPAEFFWGNYQFLIEETDFLRWTMNTLVVATAVTVLKVLFDSMAGYAFAKMTFPGKNLLFIVVLAALMVPFSAILIPLFFLVRDLGLINTYWALILPPLASPIGIFMMRQFIEGLPSDLENAARLDGCSEFDVYWRVVLPLVKPALVVLAVLTFLIQYTSFRLAPCCRGRRQHARVDDGDRDPAQHPLDQLGHDLGRRDHGHDPDHDRLPPPAALLHRGVPRGGAEAMSVATVHHGQATAGHHATERGDNVSPPAVELRGVTKRYGATTALARLSLTVGAQEFLVLLGPSGCGKSTLLKIIAGLEDATEGEIYITGRLVNYVPPKARNVAMVFQNYALYPHMTVEQNLAFPLKMNRLSKEEIRQRVTDAARLLGLESLVARYPEQLSGGQRQRVALGRAIVRDPVVYLMDEPLSNLDALLRAQTRDELMKLHRRVGRTTIYVTHDQVEAMTMADRIVVLNEGVVQQIGTPQAVYRRPNNTFVAGFIGSPRMNLIPGQFENASETDKPRFVASDLSLPLGNVGQNIPNAEGTLGIRAEDISLVPPATTGALPGRVSLVEPVGSDVFLDIALGPETSCVVRASADIDLAEGDPVHLRFATDKLHLFDGAGNRLADA